MRTWLTEGHTPLQIVEAICHQNPNATKQATDALLDEALNKIRETAEADKVLMRGWCMEAYAMCYRRMIEIGDFANALRAIDKLWKIAN